MRKQQDLRCQQCPQVKSVAQHRTAYFNIRCPVPSEQLVGPPKTDRDGSDSRSPDRGEVCALLRLHVLGEQSCYPASRHQENDMKEAVVVLCTIALVVL